MRQLHNHLLFTILPFTPYLFIIYHISHMNILVTGASNGIGFEIAKLAAAKGHTVIAVSRNEKRLSDAVDTLRSVAKNAQVHPIAVDLSDQQGPLFVFKSVEKLGLTVDCLVNNAGVGTAGRFEEISMDSHMQLLRLNIVALTQLTHFFLSDMKERGRGKILNIASTAAFHPGPFMATYYASKAYVLSFSEGLREELKSSGVTVTTLCPGPTNTGFAKTASVQDLEIFKDQNMAEAKTVARIGFDGMMNGAGVVVVGASNQLLAAASRIFPTSITSRIMARLQSSKIKRAS